MWVALVLLLQGVILLFRSWVPCICFIHCFIVSYCFLITLGPQRENHWFAHGHLQRHEHGNSPAQWKQHCQYDGDYVERWVGETVEGYYESTRGARYIAGKLFFFVDCCLLFEVSVLEVLLFFVCFCCFTEFDPSTNKCWLILCLPFVITHNQGDKEDLTAAIESLKADIGKNDGVFKRTLEQDRNKMKQELLARTQRIRALGTFFVVVFMECRLMLCIVVLCSWNTHMGCTVYILWNGDEYFHCIVSIPPVHSLFPESDVVIIILFNHRGRKTRAFVRNRATRLPSHRHAQWDQHLAIQIQRPGLY